MIESTSVLQVVAVDGPAAAGKTTTSLILAEKYGLGYLESGRAYRLMAYLALRDGVPLDDEIALIRLHHSLFGTPRTKERMFEESARYGDELRSPAVSLAVSRVSGMPLLRTEITDMIRSWVTTKGGCVVEGRDIGTVVFPAATVKFYLTAEPEVRARRRTADEAGRTYQDVLVDVMRRDHADTSRKTSPLLPAKDAVRIDTGRLTVDQVVSIMSSKCTEAGLISFPRNVTADAR